MPPVDVSSSGVQASLSGNTTPFEIEALHIAPSPLEVASAQEPVVQHYTSVEAEMAPMQFQPQGVPNYVDFGHSSHSGNVMPADCCMGCDRSYYVNAEAIWFNRSGDRGFSLSRAALMDPFSYEIAGRITLGQMFDCLMVLKLSTLAAGLAARRLTTGTGLVSHMTTNGYLASDIDTFNNSTTHQQAWRAQYQSFEFNRRWWAWDIMSTMIGIRGMDYEEDYAFNAVHADGGLGFHRVSTDNFFLGLQTGLDAFYPISQRLSIGSRARLGVFANFNEGRTFLANRGVTRLNAGDKDVDIAGLIETGAVARYRILPSVVATAGYEIWYLAGVATAPNQGVIPITPLTGSRVSAADEVLFHGATAGIEVSF